MATITLTTVHRDVTRRRRKLVISGLVAGAYVQGGVTIDWATVKNPKMLPLGTPASNPTFAEVTNAPDGYGAELIPGSTMHNWLLKIYSANNVELAAGNFSAGLLADPFLFEVSGAIGSF